MSFPLILFLSSVFLSSSPLSWLLVSFLSPFCLIYIFLFTPNFSSSSFVCSRFFSPPQLLYLLVSSSSLVFLFLFHLPFILPNSSAFPLLCPWFHNFILASTPLVLFLMCPSISFYFFSSCNFSFCFLLSTLLTFHLCFSPLVLKFVFLFTSFSSSFLSSCFLSSPIAYSHLASSPLLMIVLLLFRLLFCYSLNTCTPSLFPPFSNITSSFISSSCILLSSFYSLR